MLLYRCSECSLFCYVFVRVFWVAARVLSMIQQKNLDQSTNQRLTTSKSWQKSSVVPSIIFLHNSIVIHNAIVVLSLINSIKCNLVGFSNILFQMKVCNVVIHIVAVWFVAYNS